MLAILFGGGILDRMGMTAFPEWVQSQKLVSKLAEGLGGALIQASARAILDLRFDGPSLDRRSQLASNGNEELLCPEGHAEYEPYAQLRGLLSIPQCKARLNLKQSA
jgi:hypothetical protein